MFLKQLLSSLLINVMNFLVVTISFAALQACSSGVFNSMMHFCFSFLLLSIPRQRFIPPRRRQAWSSPLLVVASSPFCPASSNPPLALYCQAKLLCVQQVDCCVVSVFLIAPAPLPRRQIVASATLLLPLCCLFSPVFHTLDPAHCLLNTPYYGLFVCTSPWPSGLGLAVTYVCDGHSTAPTKQCERTFAGQGQSLFVITSNITI